MKILALGDVHLGAGTDLGRVPFGHGSRLRDQWFVLTEIMHLVDEEQVDLCLFAGDAFHRRRPTPSEILIWRRFVESLNERGIDVIAVDGNHDVESADRPSALETVRTHSGYEVSRTPGLFHPSPELVVATLPWTPPARLVASLNGNVERDEVNARVAELLIDSARELRAQIPEGKVAILLAHWSVSGSSLPNGLPVDQLREQILPLPDLEALGFDLVVLGHIHKAQTLSDAPLVLYTGSPCVVDYGEANTDHGVWIYDTGQPEQARFEPIGDRRFLTVDVDLTTERHDELGLDETDAIAAAIATQFPIDEAVVRIRYRCTSEQARRVDLAALRGFLVEAGVHRIYSLAADVVREDRARVEGVDETMGELEALEAWIKANFEDDPSDKHDALRDLTARYLEGIA